MCSPPVHEDANSQARKRKCSYNARCQPGNEPQRHFAPFAMASRLSTVPTCKASLFCQKERPRLALQKGVSNQH